MKRKKTRKCEREGGKNNNYQRQLGVHQMSFLFFVLLMTFSSSIVTSIKMSAHLWNSLVESSSQTSKYVCICVCAGVLCVRARVCVCKFHSNVLTFFGIQPSLRLSTLVDAFDIIMRKRVRISTRKKKEEKRGPHIISIMMEERALSLRKKKGRVNESI